MEVTCFNCNTNFVRNASQLKRSKRHYCSRSCAVSVNNSLKPKRKRVVKQKIIIKCIECDVVIPNVTRSRKYCTDCKRKRNIRRTTQYRRDLKRRSVEYLGGSCRLCGYNRSVRALDFHHVDESQKSFTISAYANLSWPKIVKELDKCILLCANCHREKHDAGLWSGE